MIQLTLVEFFLYICPFILCELCACVITNQCAFLLGMCLGVIFGGVFFFFNFIIYCLGIFVVMVVYFVSFIFLVLLFPWFEHRQSLLPGTVNFWKVDFLPLSFYALFIFYGSFARLSVAKGRIIGFFYVDIYCDEVRLIQH